MPSDQDLSPALRAFLDPLASLIADRVSAAIAERSTADPWVDAKNSGLGVRTFRRAARAGGFPVYLAGKRWVARRSAVDAWIESQRVPFGERRASDGDPLDRAIAAGQLRVLGGGRKR